MFKRGRSPLSTAALVAVGITITVAIAAFIFAGTHSALLDRDHERTQASVAERRAADIQAQCFQSSTFDELVDCVAKETDTDRSAKQDQADLHAQQDVAALNIGMLWFSGLGFVTSGISVVLLIWTFSEQRQLTINQSRAYLELIAGHYTAQRWASIDEGEDENEQIDVTLTLYNSGETPALAVDVSLVLHCTPESSGFGDSGEPSYTITGFSGGLPEIPAKGTYVLRATGHGNLPHPKIEHAGWRYQGPSVRARGKVTFGDVFKDDRRELEISLDSQHIPKSWEDPPIELYGWHRAKHGTDRILSHEKARFEKASAARTDAPANKNKEEP